MSDDCLVQLFLRMRLAKNTLQYMFETFVLKYSISPGSRTENHYLQGRTVRT